MRTSQTLAASSVLLASLSTSVQAVTCYSGVNVFSARGTGEVPPNGLGVEAVHINAILADVPGSNATVIDYPATFGPTSVPIGVKNATSQITEYLDACPTSKIVLLGYSQGADVLGLVLTGGNFTIAPDGSSQNYTVPPLASKYGDQIAAIVFLGDPQFNINIGVNSDMPYPCNVSSHSPRDPALFAPYADRLEEWCNDSDIFCCATGTTFAGHVSYFSAANGTITGEFVAGKLGLSAGASGSSGTMSTPVAPATTAMIMPSKASSVSRFDSIPYPVSAVSVAVSRPSSYGVSKASSASRYSSASGTVRMPGATTSSTPAATSPALSTGAASRLNNPFSALTGLLTSLVYLI